MERKAPKKAYKKKTTYKKKSYKPKARHAAHPATAPAKIGQAPGDIGIHLSPATESYATAMLNPSDAPAAGMPIGGLPSEKNKCWARGRMSTGTAGVGYILAVPSNIACNDLNCAYVTGNAFAGTTLSNTVVASQVIGVKSNSAYAYANYGATSLKSRFVCGEIRIRYIGTELNRGGDAVVYCDTNHNSLLGYSEANLLSYAACGRSFIGMNEWISCKYNGVVDPTEENFVIDPSSGTLTKNANPCMVIWINSAVAAQPFDYEVWGHFEVIGSLGAAMTTVAPDPIGHTATNGASQKAQIDHPGSHEETGYVEKALTTVLHTVTTGQSRVGDNLDHKGVMQTITQGVSKYLPKIIAGVEKYGPTVLQIAEVAAAL